jgi:transcriptional regulator with XRE-family HTH domain
MSESIGAALRTARGQRRLTLQQVSEATRIRVQYLQALENDDLSAMTSVAQARGFMRIYAQFLELDLDALVPPAPSAVAQTPTVPQEQGAAAQSIEPAEPGARPGPGLLAGLRGRLADRLTRKSPATAPESLAEPTATSESDPKKKGLR